MPATLIADDTYIRSDYHSIIMDETFLSLQSYLSLFLFNILYVHMMFLFILFCHTYNWRHETEFYNIYDKPFCEGEKEASRQVFIYTEKNFFICTNSQKNDQIRRNKIFFNSGPIEFIIF
jgi:hypothetical protein